MSPSEADYNDEVLGITPNTEPKALNDLPGEEYEYESNTTAPF